MVVIIISVSLYVCIVDHIITELRLKNHHRPFQLAQLWDDFCAMYTDSSADEITRGTFYVNT